jgi:nucleoside 2-deoxyribosyltransferase
MPSLKPIRVYLSGPITGNSRRDIKSWRRSIAERLGDAADVVDPSRYHYDSTLAYKRVASPKSEAARSRLGRQIVGRNKKLIESCDLIIANFLGTGNHASIGAIAEVVFAYTMGKPVILVREGRGNVHNHAMLNAVASKVTPTLEEAVAAVPKVAGMKRLVRRNDANSHSERSR